LGAGAQRLGEVLRIVDLGRQHHHEAIAGNAGPEGPGRQAVPQQLAELREHRIADVHAGVLVDGMQLIDVDVERAPGLRALPSRVGWDWALAGSRRWARIRSWASGGAALPERTSVTLRSGTCNAPVRARRCSTVCCSSACSSLASSGATPEESGLV